MTGTSTINWGVRLEGWSQVMKFGRIKSISSGLEDMKPAESLFSVMLGKRLEHLKREYGIEARVNEKGAWVTRESRITAYKRFLADPEYRKKILRLRMRDYEQEEPEDPWEKKEYWERMAEEHAEEMLLVTILYSMLSRKAEDLILSGAPPELLASPDPDWTERIGPTHPFVAFIEGGECDWRKTRAKNKDAYKRARELRKSVDENVFKIMRLASAMANQYSKKDYDEIVFSKYSFARSQNFLADDIEFTGNKAVNRVNGRIARITEEEKTLLEKALKGPLLFSDISRREYSLLKSLHEAGLVRLNGRYHASARPRVPGIEEDSAIVVVRVTDACNLACEYCYANAGKRTGTVSEETVINAVKVFSQYYPRLTVEFHGGEPFLYFDSWIGTVNRIRRLNWPVDFAVQTNATLIDPDKARKLSLNRVSVGVSLDGPKEMHDKARHDAAGKGSWDDVMRGISVLRKWNLFAGVITTVGEHNARPRELLDFYLDNDITRVKLNPLWEWGRGKGKGMKREKFHWFYKAFIEATVNARLQGEKLVKESNFKDIIVTLSSGRTRYMCFQNPCGAGRRMFGVDHDGTVYPCEEFTGNKEFAGPNINKVKNVLQIFSHPVVSGVRGRMLEEDRLPCGPGYCKSAFLQTGRPRGSWDGLLEWAFDLLKEEPWLAREYGVNIEWKKSSRE